MLVTLIMHVSVVWVLKKKNSIDNSSGSDTFYALSFSLTSAYELGAWCTTAKLKMKVGDVSVTVEQHTEGRLQVSQSMLNFEMAVYNVVSVNPRVEAWRVLARWTHGNRLQHLIVAVPLVVGSETSILPWQQMSERCVP